MIKNIFFIHRFHFTRAYYEIDDFKFFKDNGFNVKYLDLVDRLKSSELEDTCPVELKDDVIYLRSESEFKTFLKEYAKDSIILTCVGLQVNSAWFYRCLSKNKMPYLFLDVNFFPKLSSKNKTRSISTKIKRFFEKTSPVYLFYKSFKALDYFYTKTQLESCLAVIHVKKKIRKRIYNICDKDTVFIRTNSNDWKSASDVTDRSEKQNYLAFIDQYIPYHPDFVSRDINLGFQVDEYYYELNRALKNIAEKTGLDVKVAAHPRRMVDDDYNFPLFKNTTASLVKNAKLVITHYSTAVNFAAIFNKPIVFFTSDLLNKSYIGTNVLDMAHTFKKRVVNITSEDIHQISEREIFEIDQKTYEKYVDENLVSDKNKNSSLGELVLEFLQSKKMC